MQVDISETTLVLPCSPPFAGDHVLQLSLLDTDPNLDVTFRYIRVYLNTGTDTDPFRVLSSALSSALVQYYPLAATLCSGGDQRLQLFCTPGQGVPLFRARADCTLESLNYLDDPDPDFAEQLAPDPSPDEWRVNPFMLQVTVFGCGGFTLGAAVHHALCDGYGATQFFCAMAEFALGASRVSVKPVWDRADLLLPRDPPRVEAPIRECLNCLNSGLPPREIGPIGKECFHFENARVDRFKAFLSEHTGVNFTTFEALGAFLWRAKVKATGTSANEKVIFAYSMDVRKLIKPPLPLGYWGNGCVPVYVQLTCKDVVEKPIWETAALIKKSKRHYTDEYVRSFVDFQALYCREGIRAGEEVSGFTDWRHLGHSKVDFGWGGPVTVLPLSRNLLGSVEPCFFLPLPSVNPGQKNNHEFKVLVNLRKTAMPAFSSEIRKFFNHGFESML